MRLLLPLKNTLKKLFLRSVLSDTAFGTCSVPEQKVRICNFTCSIWGSFLIHYCKFLYGQYWNSYKFAEKQFISDFGHQNQFVTSSPRQPADWMSSGELEACLPVLFGKINPSHVHGPWANKHDIIMDWQ
jgi:hypothetical protein